MKIYGNDYLLWIESATPGTFNLLKGQTNLGEDRGRPKIDTSDKTSAGYSTGGYGNAALVLSCDFNADLPDANGYSRVETASNAKTTLKCQVRKGGAAGLTADAVLEAVWNVTISNKSYPKDGVVSGKIELSLASPPTIDALA